MVNVLPQWALMITILLWSGTGEKERNSLLQGTDTEKPDCLIIQTSFFYSDDSLIKNSH